MIGRLLGLLAVKKLLRQAIFTMEQADVLAGNFALSFTLNFLSIFVHISGFIRLITLIWASLERSFPPAEVEYRWCQFWSKVMTSEVEERPRLVTAVTAGTGVNGLIILQHCLSSEIQKVNVSVVHATCMRLCVHVHHFGQ